MLFRSAEMPKTGRKPSKADAAGTVEAGAKALLDAVEQPTETVAADDVEFLTNMTPS